jgi:ABC-type Zn uptake system ZnuABC Zn-binding protein ZnuA
MFDRYRQARLLLALAVASAVAVSLYAEATRKLNVLASTSDLAALAAEVGGDGAEVESIARGYQDPHFVEAKPSYLVNLRQTDLLIVVGLQLEGSWLTQGHHRLSLISQSGNPRIQPGASGYFDASQYAEILDVPTQPATPGIQAFGNPHYWLDPENGRRIAQALAKKLSEMRPQDASYFADRFQAFNKRLSDAEKVWDAEMKPYRGCKVVTYHRSWSNFLKHFQLVSVGEIEPRPGIPPSRRHTTEVINLMKSGNVKIVLVEPYFELKTPNAIAREAGAQVVVMPSSVGGEKGITDYFQLFDCDVGLLTKVLKAIQNGHHPNLEQNRLANVPYRVSTIVR